MRGAKAPLVSQLEQRALDESSFHNLPLKSPTVQGLNIPEYTLTGTRAKGSSNFWVVGDWDECLPEEVVGFYFKDDADCDVMFWEGEMVRSLLGALCVAAYAENNGRKVITRSQNKINIHSSGGCFMAPNSEFTREYIHTFFKEFSIADVVFIWNSLVSLSPAREEVPYRKGNHPDILQAFLEAITIPRLLTMFDIALSTSVGGHMSGWPDLTVMKDGRILFVEVKVGDRLTPSQIDWIEKYASLPGIDYQVIRLLPT